MAYYDKTKARKLPDNIGTHSTLQDRLNGAIEYEGKAELMEMYTSLRRGRLWWCPLPTMHYYMWYLLYEYVLHYGMFI
jgi:hypothetical protein